MSVKRIGKSAAKTDWARVEKLTAKQIRAGIAADPDARATDAAFWKTAKVVMPKNKQTVTIRLDADLLKWLRAEQGYQTRINTVLRSYMDAHTAA